ncbi:MAG: hypothetical protein CFE44_06565 [Burkholderiales bacterium PBB4]|nr:MAG: hypothetical protein CFE44_06565 [Burkholderiales bacterium PBB4]
MKPLYTLTTLLLASGLALAGCTSSIKEPATSSVAVSKAAVDNAAGADGMQFAPVEMAAARDKMARANQAMAAKDYKTALMLADQAQVDAKLAQSKANSAKAQAVSDALQEDLRVLREELARPSNKPQ